MTTVTISATTFNVYADEADAISHLAGSVGSAAEAFLAATADNQKKALVSATRFIDRQLWQGAKTDEYQPLQFPRTGLTYRDGTEVPSTTIPQEVIDCCIELAALLAEDPDALAMPEATQAKRLKADTAEIEYFRRKRNASPYPTVFTDLLGLWLTGSSPGIAASIDSGTDTTDALAAGMGLTQGF